MATDSAHQQRSSQRQLWQAPVFLLGLAAVIAVPIARPHWRTGRDAGLSGILAEARAALEKSPPDAAQALQLANKALRSIERYPHHGAEVHFLMGSAHARLIDAAAPDANAVAQARAHLEQAERLGLGETDRPKLGYRLGKVRLLSGDAATARALLQASVDFADDPAEGYALLALACLHSDPPDVAAALEATKQQLAKAAPTSDPRSIAQARLRLGELYLRQGNVKDGRPALERIGSDAPPEIFFAARAALAESYESTREWAKAARNWDQVRTNPKLTPAAKGAALFRLGRCLAADQRPKEAAIAWEEAAALPGEEGQAAALRLAELKIESDTAAAAEAFAAALSAIKSPGDFRNHLIGLDEARQILERAAAAARIRGDIAAAQRLVELYARLAPPGRDDDMLAQAADAAAESLIEKAKDDAAGADALREQARGQWLVAARAYERAAGKVGPGAEQAQWLWRSADRYLKAQQQQGALDVLTRMAQLDGVLSQENILEAYFQIATIHHQKQQYAAARAAYQRCVQSASRFAFPARHQLALLDMIENRFDDAETRLQENRAALRSAPQADARLLEQTEYALAAVAFQRQTAIKEELREYTTAEQRFLGALQQYPNSSQAMQARFHLGQCYWFVATHKSQALATGTLSDDERSAYLKQYAENLQKAAEQFQLIEEALTARQRAVALTSEEALLLWRSSFSAAHCHFYLSNFDEAIRRYNALAILYQGQVGELGALSQVFQSYLRLKQPEQARAVLARMKDTFDKMPESAFVGNETSYQRSFWVQWFMDAEKQFAANNTDK